MTVLLQPPPPQVTHPATRSQLDWLDRQVRAWQVEGIVDDQQAGLIRTRYRADARVPLGRLLLTLGAAFVGIGVIWLVAANLDALSPAARFGGITVFWLTCLVLAEVLAVRHDRDRSSPLVGAVRLVAAMAFGAVVFQAAQSLQVPAYEPLLVGVWSLGCLVHAYAVRAVLPLVLAILTGATWFLWQVLPESDTGLTVVVCLAAVAVGAVAAAALHQRWADELAGPWRELGAAFLLATLFTAALPFVDADGADWSPLLIACLAGVTLLALAGLVVPGPSRWEVVGAVAAALAALAMAAWPGSDDVLQAVVSVGAYVLVAVGVAVVGTVRESWRLTSLATVALVVFTTFQSFSVFAQVLEGAWLFVALGVVFLGTGVAFDRARRRLATVVADVASDAGSDQEGAVR